MQEMEDELRSETSLLFDFITNGDDYYTIAHDQNSKVRLGELRKAFLNHVCSVYFAKRKGGEMDRGSQLVTR